MYRDPRWTLVLLSLLALGCSDSTPSEVATEVDEDPSEVTTQEASVPESLRYLGQTPPGLTPEVLGPGVISLDERSEFGSVFTAEGDVLYFGINTDEGRTEIWATRLDGESWTPPEPLITHPQYGANDPILDPSENRLYFISDRPLDGVGDPKDIDLWYVERQGEGWSESINVGPVVNSPAEDYYTSFTDDGALFFGSNRGTDADTEHDFDLYAARLQDGVYQAPERLPGAVNSEHYEADVFVAPDESYVIFSSVRPEGLGRGDLYVSVRGDDGQWSEARSLGAPINTEGHELCPVVTRDGRYLLYTSNHQLLWVDAAILEPFL